MDHGGSDGFGARVSAADVLVGKGDLTGAVAILQELVHTTLPDADKAMLFVNLAVCHTRMGSPDPAFAAYDKAIQLERRAGRIFAAASKGAYLVALGRRSEALAFFRELLTRKDLSSTDRAGIEQNVAALERQA